MKRLLVPLGMVCTLLAAPAWAQISAPTSIGAVRVLASAAGGVSTMATTVSAPTGALIIVMANDSCNYSANPTPTVTDDVGNTYSLAVLAYGGGAAGGAANTGMWYSYNSIALPSGHIITYTDGSSPTNCTSNTTYMSAVYSTGAVSASSPLDNTASAVGNTTSTNPSVSITPASGGTVLYIGIEGNNSSLGNPLTWTWATPPNTFNQNNMNGGNMLGSGAQTFNITGGSVTANRNWATLAATFKAPATASVNGLLSLMGVGH